MYEILKKTLPDTIKNKLYSLCMNELKKLREGQSKKIPKYELNEKHISNLRVITDREKLLELLPKNAVVAEIGVDKGEYSELILRITKPEKLHLIDMWSSKRYHEKLMKTVKNKFHKEISEKTIIINRGVSTEAVNGFEDNYFDWIYIDTGHSYETTAEELKLYSQKVKPSGIIAGHDFIIGNWDSGFRYGVIEAVYEFCVNNDWEIIYLTMEINNNPSFAIRRISFF